ncbi:transcription factor btf3 [Sporothrix schenckii 1099-18]|uniref:Transcription factor btf3 n=1 Tax=Sporothrix schenckii 1099-18 TaxID=1397361 RepID=A0A0F2MM44_SPOSC|nr:transcription factor btf3 [Sporothrix schenckii 1099-18]KJR89915.1 transcription factor btf3 [Sporothrix schenckii 1099-18]
MAEGHHPHLPHLHSGGAADDIDEVDNIGATSGTGGRNPHASANRWRHQESPAFARHAAASANKARDEERPRGDVKDLTAFLNASRITPAESAGAAVDPSSPTAAKYSPNSGSAARFTPIVVPGEVGAAATGSPAAADGQAIGVPSNGEEILVGPLLNYRRMEDDRWIGSALIVTRGGGKTQPFVPTALIGPVRNAAEQAPAPTDGPSANGTGSVAKASGGSAQEIQGICLYSDPRNTFWRFDLSVPMGETESRWQYSFPGLRYTSDTKPRINIFSVPAVTEAMRILFFSCNGFSVGTDEDAWSGPALWNDVIRYHAKTPFHVMIGGGDQIYNDSIRVTGPLREWTAIGNPKKRHDFPFTEKLRAECDDFYLNNYIKWYSTEPFAATNGQIPQLNIWDDHDIIDGFGSYVNEFMKCDVFRGIGGTAHKYYMLFQHHLPPPASTYTSDAPQVAEAHQADLVQLVDTYVAPPIIEPNYIIGSKPGPYVAEYSHNMYCKLGARMAFVGLDARTERTRHQVNYPETYEQIFSRLTAEFRVAAAADEPIKHLILLLGIPIAYPRLTWLENVFSSPLLGPVKFMNRRFGFGGGFFNYFDGNVDLLDDLDDHYTARTHKKERNWFIERLQVLSAEHSVRITILGGDVHLAALGRFYANPDLNVASENDYRFMINVVSSAITNKPPPAAIANLLARRNKIHHLNSSTDETLFKLFNKDPGTSTKTASHNQVTMPSRNFAIITENSPNNTESEERPRPQTIASDAAVQPKPPPSRGSSRFGRRSASRRREMSSNEPPRGSSAGASTAGGANGEPKAHANGRNGHHALHAGEEGAGTEHRAASDLHGKGNDGSLDVCIRVEIDQHDPEGKTEPYGLTIPPLDYTGPPPIPRVPHHFRSSRPNTGHRSTTTASSA